MTSWHWQGIVVHHSASNDSDHLDRDEIEAWHKHKGWRGIGYHFLVERVDDQYVAIMGRPLSWMGSHARNFNRTHIGVCLIGDFTQHAPPLTQLNCASDLIAGLADCFQIPQDAIVPHRELGNTQCPGDAFPFDLLMQLIQQRRGSR